MKYTYKEINQAYKNMGMLRNYHGKSRVFTIESAIIRSNLSPDDTKKEIIKRAYEHLNQIK
jgi:hypothetical protein